MHDRLHAALDHATRPGAVAAARIRVPGHVVGTTDRGMGRGHHQIDVRVAVDPARRDEGVLFRVRVVEDLLEREVAVGAAVAEPIFVGGEVDLAVPVQIGRHEAGSGLHAGNGARRPAGQRHLAPQEQGVALRILVAADQVELAVAVEVGDLQVVQVAPAHQRAAGPARTATIVLEPGDRVRGGGDHVPAAVLVEIDDLEIFLRLDPGADDALRPARVLVPVQAADDAADHQIGPAVTVQVAGSLAPRLGGSVAVHLDVADAHRRHDAQDRSDQQRRGQQDERYAPASEPCGGSASWRGRISCLSRTDGSGQRAIILAQLFRTQRRRAHASVSPLLVLTDRGPGSAPHTSPPLLSPRPTLASADRFHTSRYCVCSYGKASIIRKCNYKVNMQNLWLFGHMTMTSRSQ